MPAPSPLAIATGSLNRLVKEEQSYYKELEKQQTRLQKLKEGADEDGNKEYMIKQEETAIAETQAVFPSLQLKIQEALAKLKDQVALARENPGQDSEESLDAAEKAASNAQLALDGLTAV